MKLPHFLSADWTRFLSTVRKISFDTDFVKNMPTICPSCVVRIQVNEADRACIADIGIFCEIGNFLVNLSGLFRFQEKEFPLLVNNTITMYNQCVIFWCFEPL